MILWKNCKPLEKMLISMIHFQKFGQEVPEDQPIDEMWLQKLNDYIAVELVVNLKSEDK